MIAAYIIQIGIGSVFLISETAQYLIIQGLKIPLAWIVACALESGCLLLASQRDWFSRAAVMVMVVLALFASSMHRIAPITQADTATASQQIRLSAMTDDIRRLEDQVRVFADTGQKNNHASFSRKMTEKIEERAALMFDIASQPPQAIMGWQIGGIVVFRGIIQVVNIICAWKLGGLKRRQESVKKSQDSAIIDYIEEKGGQIKRQSLLSSKILEGVQEYDQELEALIHAGQIVVTKNGSGKGGWIYSIK